MNSEKREMLTVIDGNSLVFRAYYAMQNPMLTSKGVYTQAIFGFLNMLNKALADFPPDYIAIAFDRKAPTFRHLEYEAYKAGRKKTPDELHMQLPYVKDILAAMNITILERDGFEADDLIGTVAKAAENKGLDVLVITGDRDELQLASEKTRVLITKRGVSEFEMNTPESMREKYGFGPELFADYKAMMGDSSDNIPGLPGVGEKTAAKLIIRFGSVENLLERADEAEPERLCNIVKENAAVLQMSKRLATIVTDAPIDIDFEKMRVRAWDKPRLREIYAELEFRKFLSNLDAQAAKFEGEQAGTDGVSVENREADAETQLSFGVQNAEVMEIEIKTLEDENGLAVLQEELKNSGEIVLKMLGNAGRVEGVSVYIIFVFVNKRLFAIKTYKNEGLLKKTIEILAEACNAGAKLTGFGLQEEFFRIRRLFGAEVAGSFEKAFIDDVQIAHYLLAPSAGNLPLSQIALSNAGFALADEPKLFSDEKKTPIEEALSTDFAISFADLAAYGRDFCAAVRLFVPIFMERLNEQGLKKLYEDVELPLAAALAEVEANGFSFDGSTLLEIDKQITARIADLEKAAYELAEGTFNINSPKQLGEILFEKIGLPGGKKNKNGYSTSADVLDKLRGAHPIVSLVLEYRTLAKLKNTYIDALPTFVCEDGRIRPSFKQTAVATGRLSCADPNLQNIPVRTALGRELRKAFVAGNENSVLLGADYSQIELRVLAHLSEDPSLISDFESGADIHKRTAARVFGVASEDEVTAEQRSAAKAVNFGVIYGMSGFGLSEELSITKKEAEKFIADYFEKHAKVKEYLDACVAAAREKGYAETLLGRRRGIPELHASVFMTRALGERLAMNTPVQGSAADIIKIAMNRVRAKLYAEGLMARLVLQVHDELIVETQVSEAEQAAKVLKEEMEGAFELRVPLLCEVKSGRNWFELK